MSIDNSYNTFDKLPQMQYKIIEQLMLNSDANQLWNLLYYPTNDALDQSVPTMQQKASLIYNGDPISTPYRVFMNPFLDDAYAEEVSLLRIFPEIIIPKNRVLADITMRIECFSHVKISTLNNYTTRNVTMLQTLLKVLNGADILGVGLLSFDRMGSPYDKAILNVSNSRNYEGYSLFLSTHTA